MSKSIETRKQKVRRVVEQAVCGLFGHGRLTLSDKDGVYVDICPRCDLNYRGEPIVNTVKKLLGIAGILMFVALLSAMTYMAWVLATT